MNKDYILGIFLTFAFGGLWVQPTITPLLPVGDGIMIDVILFDGKSEHTSETQAHLATRCKLDNVGIADIILRNYLGNTVGELKKLCLTLKISIDQNLSL